MALFKEKISNNGIVSKYHRISRVNLDEENLFCAIESHVSKSYRDQGCDPVSHETYHFSYTVEEEESMGIRKLCYNKLKELEEWQDSEDC